MKVVPENLLVYGVEIDPRAFIAVVAVLGLLVFAELMPRYVKFRDKVEGDNDYEKSAPLWAKVKWVCLPLLIVFVLDTFVDIKYSEQKPVVLLGDAPGEVEVAEDVLPVAAVAVPVVAEKKAHPGQALFAAKACTACHSVAEGVKIVGPSLYKIFGRKTVVVTNGKERNITVDEAYLKKSIMNSAADLVKGYGNLMPSQQGLVNDKELQILVDYMKTL